MKIHGLKINFALALCLFAGLSFSAMATSSQDNQVLENNSNYSNIITSDSGLTFGFKDDGNIHNLELQGPVFKMTGYLGRGWSRFLNATPTTDGAVFNTSNGGVSLKVGLSGFTNIGGGFTSRSLAVVDKTVFILTSTSNLWSKPLEGGNGVNHGKLEGATQMVSIGNDLVFFFADGTLHTSESATPATLTRIGRDWGETTKIYPFSKTQFLIESGSGTIFLKDKKGNSKRIGKYSPGLLVDGTKRIYKLGNGKLVFQPASAPGQIASASNDHLSRIGFTRIHISGHNHRCWMRSAWYTIFNRYKNNSDRLVALLYDLQFRNENNEGLVEATNYVIENLANILVNPKFLINDDGKYQGALDGHLYTITYQLLSWNEEYRQVMINNRSGTTDMMVRLTNQFDNSNFQYMSALHSQVDVFRHNGFIEQHVVALTEELRNTCPLLVYHTGGHFEIDRLLSPEERLQYAQQQQAYIERDAEIYLQYLDSVGVKFDGILDHEIWIAKDVEKLQDLKDALDDKGINKTHQEIFDQLKALYDGFKYFGDQRYGVDNVRGDHVDGHFAVNRIKNRETSIAIDWSAELNRVAPGGLNDQYYIDLYNAMIVPDLIENVNYQDDDDDYRSPGGIGTPNAVRYRKNSLIKALANLKEDLPYNGEDRSLSQHIRLDLTVAARWGGNDRDHWSIRGRERSYIDELKYKFYMITSNFATMDRADKLVVISYLLHFGEHCPDGKLNAMHAAYVLLANADSDIVEGGLIRRLNTEEEKIRLILAETKKSLFQEIIDQDANTWVGDVASKKVHLFNRYADELGLHRILSGGLVNSAPIDIERRFFDTQYKPSTLMNRIYGHRVFSGAGGIKSKYFGFLSNVVEAGQNSTVEKKLILGLLQQHSFLE